MNDLNARIRQAERIVAEQNANLAALRHLLGKETGEFIQEPLTPATISSVAARKPQVQEVVDFKGRTSNVILALVRQRNGHGCPAARYRRDPVIKEVDEQRLEHCTFASKRAQEEGTRAAEFRRAIFRLFAIDGPGTSHCNVLRSGKDRQNEA